MLCSLAAVPFEADRTSAASALSPEILCLAFSLSSSDIRVIDDILSCILRQPAFSSLVLWNIRAPRREYMSVLVSFSRISAFSVSELLRNFENSPWASIDVRQYWLKFMPVTCLIFSSTSFLLLRQLPSPHDNVRSRSCRRPSGRRRDLRTCQYDVYSTPSEPQKMRVTEPSPEPLRRNWRVSLVPRVSSSVRFPGATASSISLSCCTDESLGASLYRARQTASRIVLLPAPVSPHIRNIGSSLSGAAEKSMKADSIDAIFFISSDISSIYSVFQFPASSWRISSATSLSKTSSDSSISAPKRAL